MITHTHTWWGSGRLTGQPPSLALIHGHLILRYVALLHPPGLPPRPVRSLGGGNIRVSRFIVDDILPLERLLRPRHAAFGHDDDRMCITLAAAYLCTIITLILCEMPIFFSASGCEYGDWRLSGSEGDLLASWWIHVAEDSAEEGAIEALSSYEEDREDQYKYRLSGEGILATYMFYNKDCTSELRYLSLQQRKVVYTDEFKDVSNVQLAIL